MSAPTIPGYITGTWDIDATHSNISFTVRHLGVSKVRGRFDEVSGSITTGERVEDSSVTATIAAASVDTGNADRDTHIKAEEFLNAEKHESLSFSSTGIRADGEDYAIDGELTVRGVTKQVTLAAEVGGIGDGLAEGSTVIGISARTEIKRSDFEVAPNVPTGVLGDKITIELDIEALLRK
ncbi:YceI family protein [Sciscionella marina]|uniref:YceI family protein n=1 Tax=Sciscionella marina TaxID=508770 RepID=UPI0003701AA6|nr:YceI family protein [Sciscionella marina]